MAGKRKQRDLRGVDPQSEEYWEEILGRENLGLSQGHSTHLVYVGDCGVLERIEGERRMDNGGVTPK